MVEMQINWQSAKIYEDILYHKTDGIAKITINRPHKRNAFRPKTVFELYDAFCNAREDTRIGVVLHPGRWIPTARYFGPVSIKWN